MSAKLLSFSVLLAAVALAQAQATRPAPAPAAPPVGVRPGTALPPPQPGVAAGATPPPGSATVNPVPASSAGIPTATGRATGTGFGAGGGVNTVNGTAPRITVNDVDGVQSGALNSVTSGSIGGATGSGSIGGATGTAIGGATGGGSGSATGAAVGGMSANAAVQESLQTTTTSDLVLPPPAVVAPHPGSTATITPGAPPRANSQIAPGNSARPNTSATTGGTGTARRRPAAGNGDDALTTQDLTVLERLRNDVTPTLKTTEPTPANVNFILRNGVVILVGNITSETQRQRLLASVRGTPGVVSVVDELQLTGAAAAASGQRRETIVNPSPSIVNRSPSPATLVTNTNTAR